jgi:hypothetical protein
MRLAGLLPAQAEHVGQYFGHRHVHFGGDLVIDLHRFVQRRATGMFWMTGMPLLRAISAMRWAML